MGAVRLVARWRLTRHWRAVAVAGVLLGLGFGLCFSSLVAARRTSSAYDRVLTSANAPDAAVAFDTGAEIGPAPEEGEKALRSIDGIERQRVFAGFVGGADGVDPVLTTALLAPIRNRFPLATPTLRAGRLPRPDALDEVLIGSDAAERGGLGVGDRLHFRFLEPGGPGSAAAHEAEERIVAVGTLPQQAVADETAVSGLVTFSRAFYDAHRDLVVYATSNVDLAPGFDARRDLAPALGRFGFQLQTARSQEQQATNEALRPILIVLVAFGVLAFGATVVAAAQVVQRSRDRWLDDSFRLRALGTTRNQIRATELAMSGVIAGVAVATALGTMLLASPVAPIGPLHDLDPAQGFGIDWTVALVGAATVVATLALLTLAFSSARQREPRPARHHSPSLARLPRGVAAAAGLTLALRADDGRGRGWRGITATTAAAALLALCAAFVTSAVALVDTPSRYGFDADLVALNAYGDQSPSALANAFGDRHDVEAATGFTSGSFLLEGRAVPGLAASEVKGKLAPTLLRGHAARAEDEIVVGDDTLQVIGAEVGDVVDVQLLTTAGASGERAGAQRPLRIVGVATFPAVNMIGRDMPRLGTGALVTRDAFLRLDGDASNQPEFTTVRLVDDADPAAVIAANEEGFRDAAQTNTTWFTDAKPAEILQLDAAMGYLRGALAVGYAILLAVIVHALWTIVRANRHDLAVLRVLACSRRQLDGVTAWQAFPTAVGALVLGLPIGLALGRLAYARFAQSLAVVDDGSIPVAVLGLLVLGVVVAALVAALAAMTLTRGNPTAALLRNE
jgi:ABC-type lipoprotein release transport system permease subunit